MGDVAEDVESEIHFGEGWTLVASRSGYLLEKNDAFGGLLYGGRIFRFIGTFAGTLELGTWHLYLRVWRALLMNLRMCRIPLTIPNKVGGNTHHPWFLVAWQGLQGTVNGT